MKLKPELMMLVLFTAFEAHCMGRLTLLFGSYAVGMVLWMAIKGFFIISLELPHDKQINIMQVPAYIYGLEYPNWAMYTCWTALVVFPATPFAKHIEISQAVGITALVLMTISIVNVTWKVIRIRRGTH